METSGYMNAAPQGCQSQPKQTRERNPEAITSRLDQLIYGMNGCIHATENISRKLFGPHPECMDKAISNMVEPPATAQIDMLQAKMTELQKSLESIQQAL